MTSGTPVSSVCTGEESREQTWSASARCSVIVEGRRGLHLRAAAEVVQVAGAFESVITVECRGARADAKSILSLASLGVAAGTTLMVDATGTDAEQAVVALSELFAAGFRDELDELEES